MKRLKLIVLLLALLAPLQGAAQSFSTINFPTDLCAGADTTVSFGFNSQFNIVIDTGHATLSLADRAFLPDGIPCGGTCSYSSPITFTDFATGDHITSANDIKYVRINMEHSFIGDIYIALTCPNGQRVSLMNWKGTGSSQCKSSVPQNNRNWTSGSNTSGGTYLGEAYDYTGSPACDSTANYNQPGIGWNYCWSDNNNSGYVYASGDALIYRSANTISHYNTLMNGTRTTVDSSNVAAGTKFYHPQENFSNLIGCPLNGQWTIDVIDAYSSDNGYIFEWEMALDPSLLPNPCPLTDKMIVSNFAQQVDDTTFRLTVPDTLAADTTVTFTLMLINSCGDTVDTTISVRLHVPVMAEAFDTACDSYTFRDSTYTSDDTVHILSLSQYGCDSLTVLNFTINTRHDTIYYDTVVENNLPYVVNGYSISPRVSQATIDIDTMTVEGCDSTIRIILTVGFNSFDTIRDTVCRHTLPYTFDSLALSPSVDDLLLSLTYRDWIGADSTVTLMLHILPDDTLTVTDSIVTNQLPYAMGGETFGSATDTTITYTNSQGCDSTVHYMLFVWPNVGTIIDSTVCRHQLPVTFNGMTVNPVGSDTTVALTYADVHGADSTVTFKLHVNPDYYMTVADTVLENQLPHTACGTLFNAPADTLFYLSTENGCDSTIHYTLNVWFNATSSVTDTMCRHALPMMFNGVAVAPHGNDTTVTVTITTTHGADSTITLSLHVNPDSYTEVLDTVVENQLPVTFDGAVFYSPSDTTFMHTNRFGCDSTVHYRLHVWYNIAQTFDTAVCENQFPVVWHGEVFDTADTVVLNLFTSHRADSTVTLHMGAYPVYDTTIVAETCDNHPYRLGLQYITETGHYEAMLGTIHGCDSLVRLDLTVWPTYSEFFTDTVCASSGIDFDGVHYMQSGIYTHRHETVHGCDSLLTLSLNLRGLNLKAKAQIVPLIPTPENLTVNMRDVSRAAIDRLWIVGDVESTEQVLTYTYPEAEDSVEAMLIAYSNDDCADTAVTVIRIDRSTLFAPNAFTPARDDNNRWQLFGMQVPYLEVWIYNRQGLLVATYKGIEGSWDGTDLNGHPCQQGAYVFKASYRTLMHPEREQSMTGTILLIR